MNGCSNLPPGCTAGMIDTQVEGPCEVCGKHADDCICPECPICGDYGDPQCYEKHGLVKAQAQIDSRQALLDQTRKEGLSDA